MRLINNSTLQLELFHGDEHPPYAILSHTWAEEEVTFQDMNDPAAREKAINMKGFTKIQRTCETAREESIPYSWVDTCCIDKTSGAELSESINSMFRWYRDAVVCYVDLPGLTCTMPETDEYCAELQRCRWFTRGWTLQELIAPRKIKFFNSGWHSYQTKDEIAPQLVEITGIEEGALLGGMDELDQTCAARKMFWASKRQTTKIEDMAYCLLGIFDINMPMLYGEGVKAFLRLQEEIFKKTADLSLLTWTSHDPSEEFSGVFARSPSEFQLCSEMTIRYPRPPPDTCAIVGNYIRIDRPDLYFSASARTGLDLGVKSLIKPIGIFLQKTPDGYVRLRPSKLECSRWWDPNHLESVLYLQIHLPRWRLESIAADLMNTVVLRTDYSYPYSIELNAVKPSRFFDPAQGLMFKSTKDSFYGQFGFQIHSIHSGTSPCFLVTFIMEEGVSVPFFAIQGIDEMDAADKARIEKDFASQAYPHPIILIQSRAQTSKIITVVLEGQTVKVSVEFSQTTETERRPVLTVKILHAPP